jgi:hypothetical protein
VDGEARVRNRVAALEINQFFDRRACLWLAARSASGLA